MTFQALKLYNLEFTSNVKSTHLSRRPRKSYNPLTSARCARRAILCTVLPKPISSARIPLMPCKKSMNLHFRLTTFLSMQDLKNEATYFLLGLLLRDISYQLHFHSFLGHIFFSPQSICTSQSHCKLDMHRAMLSAIYNLPKAWNCMQFWEAEVS